MQLLMFLLFLEHQVLEEIVRVPLDHLVLILVQNLLLVEVLQIVEVLLVLDLLEVPEY